MSAPRATLEQAAILVGGLGTRLGALAADTPKPLLPVGDRPFLGWVLRELARHGVREALLLAGHLPGRVAEELPGLLAALPVPMRVEVSLEPFRAGTAGAVRHAGPRLAPRFLLLNGDSWLDAPLGRLLADFAAAPPGRAAQVALRRVPDASRYGVVSLSEDGDRVAAFSPRPPGGAPAAPGLINAGIYAVERDALLPRLPEAGSLEGEVWPALAAEGRLGATELGGYFVDIGVPEDLARARAELPVRLARPALLLDRDGVLNLDHGWVGTRERFDWAPGAREGVRRAAEAGWHVMVVTNQSGVARGLYDEAALRELMAWVADELRAAGGALDDWRHCPHHPEAPLPAWRRDCPWRKPAPGMILDLIARWGLDPARCRLIGDQPSDLAAAAAAGVPARLLAPGEGLDAAVAEAIGAPRQPLLDPPGPVPGADGQPRRRLP